MGFLHKRSFYEGVVVTLATLFFSLVVGLLGGLSLKFQVALAVALIGGVVMLLIPEKRSFSLFLWVMVFPLSIEKILHTGIPLWEGFRGSEIILSGADAVLIFIAAILLYERLVLHRRVFVWDAKVKIILALLMWGVISFAIHAIYYQDAFIHSSQYGLLHMIRNVLFVLIMGSAIQTRADLIWIVLAIVITLLIQSGLVFLSYLTGEMYNFSRLLGQYTELQKYTAGGTSIFRATGTLGVSNQQALFHASFTFLIVSLFGVKNTLIRYIALLAILASFGAVVFTFSRSAWFAMGVACLLLTFLFLRARKVTPRAMLGGAVVFIIMAVMLGATARPIIDRLTKGDNGATDSRLRMVELAKDLFMAYPVIGVGPNEYVEAGLALYPPGQKEPEWVPEGDEAIVPPTGRIELATSVEPNGNKIIVPLGVHNKYLLTLSELGIVGLLLWLSLFYVFFKEIKQCTKSNDPFLSFIGRSGYAVLAVALIYTMLDLFSDDKTLQILLYPMVVVGAAAKISKKQFK